MLRPVQTCAVMKGERLMHAAAVVGAARPRLWREKRILAGILTALAEGEAAVPAADEVPVACERAMAGKVKVRPPSMHSAPHPPGRQVSASASHLWEHLESHS